MKLAFLTACYPPPLEGGSVVFLHNLIANLPPQDVVVITNARLGQEAFDQAQPYRIWRSGTLWRDFGKLAKVRVLAEWFLRFSGRLRRERVDLLHAGDLLHSGTMAWILGRLWRKPYVVYVYGEELNCQLKAQGGPWTHLRSAVYSRVLRSAAGIVGISDYTLSLLPAFGVPAERAIKIVPTVTAVPKVSEADVQAARTRYGLAAQDRVVLTVGRLIERKGQDNLIRAYARIRAAIPRARLVIVGQGPAEPLLRALLAELGLERSVILAGFVPGQELACLFEICDVFAMPHRELADGDTEGYGTVFLEASAHGKPVVGGRAGGVRDAILHDETGLLVDGNSTEEIAAALSALLSDSALAKRLGEYGRRRVLEELTPSKGAKALLAYCSRILADAGSAR